MKLQVQRLGAGYPFIILHGLYGSGDNWLTIARSLSAICEVFLVDQRNHGKAPHADEHNYQVLADDLLEMMVEYELDKAVILGHSMGGKAAMLFAAQHPSRVSQLIVIDISPGSYIGRKSNSNHSFFHQKVMKAMLGIDFDQVTGLGDIDRQLEASLPDKLLRQFLLKNIVKDGMMKFSWRLNLPVLLRNIDNLSIGIDADLSDGVSIDQFPVLFVRGENSHYITSPDILLIGKLFPNAQIVTIKQAGHWLHAEQPAALIELIRKQIAG